MNVVEILCQLSFLVFIPKFKAMYHKKMACKTLKYTNTTVNNNTTLIRYTFKIFIVKIQYFALKTIDSLSHPNCLIYLLDVFLITKQYHSKHSLWQFRDLEIYQTRVGVINYSMPYHNTIAFIANYLTRLGWCQLTYAFPERIE